MAHAQASQPMNDDLISRNRALLTQASAIRAYAALLREETAEAVLTAHLTQLRAWLRPWRDLTQRGSARPSRHTDHAATGSNSR
jgi:hypothetical protein